MDLKVTTQANWIDLLKALAAQVIVFHHFFIYGPISRGLAELFPSFAGAMFGYGSYAVQIFLVLGGYLAIQSLPKTLRNLGLLKTLLNRYLRLVPPYIVALVITMFFAYITRHWMNEEYVGLTETWPQILSHLFLLHGFLGHDSISAGVWYVAIDWQLYAFTAILLFLIKRKILFLLIFSTLVLTSLLFFNRDPAFENYFIYFIGAYGLGVLANLASQDHQEVKLSRAILFGFVLVVLLAFFHQIWFRNLLAVIISLFLYLKGSDLLNCMSDEFNRLIRWLSERSYCLFLIHFAFVLMMNTIVVAKDLESPIHSIWALLVGWGLSVIASHFLYTKIESTFRKFQLK
jgi:peptidoglycan/LPS O-acetylase OafA/YrhL